MYKKQLLKIRRGRKLIGAGLLSLMLVGMLGNVHASSEDRWYEKYSGVNGFATSTEKKEDYTSSYIWHQGNIAANVQVKSMGINYTANGGSYYIEVGRAAYLPNYVKENGQDTCYLYLTPSPATPANLHGYWSPDSV